MGVAVKDSSERYLSGVIEEFPLKQLKRGRVKA